MKVVNIEINKELYELEYSKRLSDSYIGDFIMTEVAFELFNVAYQKCKNNGMILRKIK